MLRERLREEEVVIIKIRWKRRGAASILGTIMLVGASILLSVVSEAKAWKPDRPIELIVPSSPGGGFDKTVRLIEKVARESKLVEVPITVVNKSGGGGNVALSYLQQRPADGHTLMITSTALLANHIVGRSKITYRDLRPVATLFNEYIGTIVLTGSPFSSPDRLMDELKKSPETISFGFCCALGGGNHLAAAMLVKAVGGDVKRMKTVVFKGAGDVTTAVLGGHIVAASNAASNARGPIMQGQMKVVAIAAPKGMGGILKGVPTWRDQGVDVVMALWRNMIGLKDMPIEHVQFWEQTILKITQSDVWKDDLANNVWNDLYKNSADSTSYLDEQYKVLSDILADVGLTKR